MLSITKLLLVVCLTACVFADHHTGDYAINPRGEIRDSGRLFVTDAASNHVYVYDVIKGEWLEQTLPGLLGSSTLPYTTDDGRYVIVSSRNGNAVTFMSTGLVVLSDIHGDAVLRSNPTLSSVELSQTAPGHVSSFGGQLVVFFDGTLSADTPPEQVVVCLSVPTS